MTNEITQYFDVLEQLVKDEQQLQKESDQRLLKKKPWFRYLEIFMMMCLVIWIICLILSLLMPWIKKISELFFILGLLPIVILIVCTAYSKGSALSSARCNGEVDSKYLGQLMAFSKQTLELGCIELEHGRNWFYKGLGSLSGAIDKVGLIPSILTLSALYAIPDKLPEWAFPLVVISGILYVVSFIFQGRLMRFERMLDLTKLALILKEDHKHNDLRLINNSF